MNIEQALEIISNKMSTLIYPIIEIDLELYSDKDVDFGAHLSDGTGIAYYGNGSSLESCLIDLAESLV